jgi:hypothetical protein
MATDTPLGSPRAQTPQKQHAGLLKLDAQPSAASSRPPGERGAEGLFLGVASSHSGHLRGIGPRISNLQGSWSPATEQPGIRGLRIGLPARPWRLRDACGLSRLNDFLALWSQAYMPSCDRQVTSTSIHMARPGPSVPRGHAPL